jgi:anti-anti-sigma factor
MAEAKLEVGIREEGNIAVIDLRGEINAFAEAALINAYMEARSTEAKSLALNFSDVEYINSTGIALIVSLLARARKDNIRLKRSLHEYLRNHAAVGLYADRLRRSGRP